MRHSPTQAERLLWQRLRRSQLGVRFRTQVVIGQFIADFFCRREISSSRSTAGCTTIVATSTTSATACSPGSACGCFVRNEEVLEDLDAVVRHIAAALQA